MTSEPTYQEVVQLETARKWEYLRRYYAVAPEFYSYEDEAVSEEEIAAAVRAFKEKPTPLIRRTVHLRDWKFLHDPDDQGLKEEYFSKDLDDEAWEEVQVPHSTRYIPEDPIRYGDSDYPFRRNKDQPIWYAETDNWYRKRLDLGKLRSDETAYLRFESVNLLSDIWVNDNPVMIQHLGLFPFEIDVTEELGQTSDERVNLAVRVRNIVTNRPWLFYNGFQLSYYNPPQTSGELGEDWYDQSWTGIGGEAVLEVLNRVHIRDAFVFTDKIVDSRAALCCRVNFRNTSWQRFRGQLRIEISPWLPEEGEIVHQTTAGVDLLPLKATQVNAQFTLDNPSLWSPDHPNLYLAHLVLEDESGKAIDDIYETFGIRTIKMVGTNYYLNNTKLYVRGTHDVCHYWSESEICPSDHAIVKDILLHKKMGANCSRWPSDLRIHYKRIADYCDQLGYMLAWAGYFEVWLSHPEMEMYATRDVKALVRSLRNCPSVIIWEMGDEPLMRIKNYRRFQWYEQVYELVKAQDDTRPILPAGHFSAELLYLYEEMKSDGTSPDHIRKRILEDFPIYNLDLTYWDIHSTIMSVPDRPFRDYMSRVKEAFGGHRLTILTEFGFDALPEPTKVADVYGGFRWGANPLWYRDRTKDDLSYYGKVIGQEDWRETQAAQAIALSSAITYLRENPEYFAGFYFMTMFDIWTYMQGVTDEKGNPKLGYYVARSLCQPLLISALHGSAVHTMGQPIEVTVSNLGETRNANVLVRFLDSDGDVVLEQKYTDLEIKGNVNVTPVSTLATTDLKPGLYQAELLLNNGQGDELARTLELFYLDE